MTPELVTAGAAVLTFVVIAVSAVAALQQLRHIRAANQLAGIMRYVEWFEAPKMQQAIKYIGDDLPGHLRNVQYRGELLGEVVSRTSHPELFVADWFEQAGSYVKYGLIADEQFLDLAGTFVSTMWQQLEPVIAMRRIAGGPAMYENFEYLAVRMRAFAAQHPHGNYPRGCPRLMTQERARALLAQFNHHEPADDAASSAIGVETNHT